jgi:hypothetical protein
MHNSALIEQDSQYNLGLMALLLSMQYSALIRQDSQYNLGLMVSLLVTAY